MDKKPPIILRKDVAAPVGRPRKTLKNYPELTLKAIEETNRLQAEANSIALRFLALRKKELLSNMVIGIEELTVEQLEKVTAELKEI